MVHWPEVMVTYDDKDRVLFSADGFGKFGALDAEDVYKRQVFSAAKIRAEGKRVLHSEKRQPAGRRFPADVVSKIRRNL